MGAKACAAVAAMRAISSRPVQLLASLAGAPKLTVDFSRQNVETHGNTITLKFQNLLLADKTTLAGTKSPEELLALFNTLTNAGFVVKLAPPPRAP